MQNLFEHDQVRDLLNSATCVGVPALIQQLNVTFSIGYPYHLWKGIKSILENITLFLQLCFAHFQFTRALLYSVFKLHVCFLKLLLGYMPCASDLYSRVNARDQLF